MISRKSRVAEIRWGFWSTLKHVYQSKGRFGTGSRVGSECRVGNLNLVFGLHLDRTSAISASNQQRLWPFKKPFLGLCLLLFCFNSRTREVFGTEARSSLAKKGKEKTCHVSLKRARRM